MCDKWRFQTIYVVGIYSRYQKAIGGRKWSLHLFLKCSLIKKLMWNSQVCSSFIVYKQVKEKPQQLFIHCGGF